MLDLHDFDANFHLKTKCGMNAPEIDISLEKVKVDEQTVGAQAVMEEKCDEKLVDKESLCTVRRDEGGYYITKNEKKFSDDQSKKVWLQLRPLPNNRGENIKK